MEFVGCEGGVCGVDVFVWGVDFYFGFVVEVFDLGCWCCFVDVVFEVDVGVE